MGFYIRVNNPVSCITSLLEVRSLAIILRTDLSLVLAASASCLRRLASVWKLFTSCKIQIIIQLIPGRGRELVTLYALLILDFQAVCFSLQLWEHLSSPQNTNAG